MSSVPFYLPWSGNLLSQATTITVDAGEDADYPIANVIDGNPAWPAKNSGTTIRIRAHFGSGAVSANVAAAIHHTLGDATVLRIQANNVDDFTAPPLNIAFPARTPIGGEYRQNALVEIAPVGVDVSTPYSYWSFAVLVANAVPVWFGQLWLGAATPFHDDFRYEGNEDSRLLNVIEQLTYGDVSLRLKKGFLRETVKGTIRGRYADTLQYLALFNELGGLAEPVLVVADPAHASALMALLDQATITRALQDIDAYDLQLAFRELSKGLAFPLS